MRACVRAAYARYVERIGREPAPMTADYSGLIRSGVVYVLRLPAQQDIQGVLVLRPSAEELWIDNVAVHPQHQHRGYGRRLLQFAEQQARAADVRELRLYTHELMVENIKLYTRLGYAEFDRREDEGFRRVFMSKRVPPA